MNCLSQYYRCLEGYIRFAQGLPNEGGVFQFAEASSRRVVHGRYADARPAAARCNALEDAEIRNGTVCLPYDPSQAIDA
jgi:hypothetical protein